MADDTGAQEQAGNGQLQIGAREPERSLQWDDQDAEAVQHRCCDTSCNTKPCENQDVPAASELGEVDPGGGLADRGRRAGDGIQNAYDRRVAMPRSIEYSEHNAQKHEKCHGILAPTVRFSSQSIS